MILKKTLLRPHLDFSHRKCPNLEISLEKVFFGPMSILFAINVQGMPNGKRKSGYHENFCLGPPPTTKQNFLKGTLSYFLTPCFYQPNRKRRFTRIEQKKRIKKYCDLAELWLLKVWVFSSSRPNLKLKSVTSPRQKLSRVTSSEHFDESSINISRIMSMNNRIV